MCEDPGYGYSSSGERIKVNPKPSAPTIDLRGIYRQPGKPELDAREPEDLVTYGIRVPEHAIIATPTWGEQGLERYRQAVAVSENVVFDLSRQIED